MTAVLVAMFFLPSTVLLLVAAAVYYHDRRHTAAYRRWRASTLRPIAWTRGDVERTIREIRAL